MLGIILDVRYFIVNKVDVYFCFREFVFQEKQIDNNL